jgi:hypothetical protein
LGSGRAHGGKPVIRWMAANVAVAQDSAGNLQPAKDKSTERIDGIVAIIMAIGRAMVAQREPRPAYSMFLCLSRAATPPKPEELRRRLPYARPDGYPSLGTFLLYPNLLTCKLNVLVDLGTC